MQLNAIKTHPITTNDKLEDILDKYIKNIEENSIIAITSKIVSICEGAVVKIGAQTKLDLIHTEAELYLDSNNKYNINLTIKNNMLIASAGIDESNGNDYYILYPRDSWKSAEYIRVYLLKKFNIKNLGVVITDSKTTPLRYGTTGFALSCSGFLPLNSYIGKPDIFGKTMRVTKANMMDSIAGAAVLVMGEGSECIPLVTLKEVPRIQFIERALSKEEIQSLEININDDLYSQLLIHTQWHKGGIK